MKTGHIVYMGLMIIVALLGLALAAKAHDSALMIAGFLLFGFGVLQNFIVITKTTGQ